MSIVKDRDGDRTPVSDLRLFEVFFDKDERQASIIEKSDEDKLLEATKFLHFAPGVNPFNKKLTARAVVIRVGKPGFSDPLTWLDPGRTAQDENGVPILMWEDFSVLWPIKSNDPGIGRKDVSVGGLCLGDLRDVEISTGQGWVSAIIRKDDVRKFLENQQYLGRAVFESKDGEHIEPVDSLPEASVSVRIISVYKLEFSGPYWHTSPDMENGSSKGARIVLIGKCQTVFDPYKGC